MTEEVKERVIKPFREDFNFKSRMWLQKYVTSLLLEEFTVNTSAPRNIDFLDEVSSCFAEAYSSQLTQEQREEILSFVIKNFGECDSVAEVLEKINLFENCPHVNIVHDYIKTKLLEEKWILPKSENNLKTTSIN